MKFIFNLFHSAYSEAFEVGIVSSCPNILIYSYFKNLPIWKWVEQTKQ
jgi:hypothetical protein